jgi:mannose/fructose/N-acetylgalactosamine-specific phosphotransferase system component IIC
MTIGNLTVLEITTVGVGVYVGVTVGLLCVFVVTTEAFLFLAKSDTATKVDMRIIDRIHLYSFAYEFRIFV